ncbi:MAG: hypothetical protein C7B45_17225 [Sulfobacillus acidophilus]|uniref:Uncharacterized protein n=1 Tax=Sulfobacillus acidophilus TaxID=53633 RepID=A0A2T2WCM2_9FIRM|nr:MAG: hypothetical protein C7B45_17225 [Sulfobacillus acidophilus]
MMPFRPPTEHYDERLKDIDEKISALISERYAISEGNPGIPRSENLKDWADKYDTPLIVLQHLFAFLHRRPDSRERVQPDQFLRFVPVMATAQHNDILVMVPYIRQHNNCSLVAVELEGTNLNGGAFHHLDIKLSIDGYDAMPDSGQSNDRHANQNFIVTPPIPDDEIPRLNMTVEYESRPFRHMEEETRLPIPPTTVRFSPSDPKAIR